MNQVISIGKQDFEQIRKNHYFYIDKTHFIREWWEAGDDVTLITRPRRFGKTLNMDMLKCFFSNQYAGRSDLFEGLSVWKSDSYQKLQGSYPVIFLTFADVKADNYVESKNSMIACINEVYQSYRYILNSSLLTDGEKEIFKTLDAYVNNPMANKTIANEIIFRSIKGLTSCLARYYGKKSSFYWMNLIRRCRKPMCMVIGKNLRLL